MNCPHETGLIYLADLPEKEVYLDLVEPFKTEFLNAAKISAGGKWNDLARVLDLPISKYNDCNLVRSFRRRHPASLFLIKKISDFLVQNSLEDFSLAHIEKNISFLCSKRNGRKLKDPKFPFNFNCKDGSIIISSLFHDGGITSRDLSVFYSNTSNKLKKRFVDSVYNLLGEVPYFEREKEVSFPQVIGLILVSLGLVPGKRQINNPEFPEFIFNFDEELILEFLGQAIADDGWIYNPDNCFGFIGFNLTVDLTNLNKNERTRIKKEKDLECLPQNLLGNIALFEKIGCRVAGPHFGNEKYYFRNKKEYRYTQEWRFQVRGHNNFQLLSKKLEIPLKYKQEKLINEANKKRLRKI